MRFVSTNESQELNFEIMGKHYKVAPGSEVEIDTAHVPYVFSRGIMLKVAPAKPAPAKSPAPVASKPVVAPKE